jgi:NB-ARC domain
MATDTNQTEEEFQEAKNYWDLEKLYIDLSTAKGKALTPVEKKLLRGLLCGFSPAEIAHKVYQSSSSSTVRVYLSNGLYKYLEEMLSFQDGHSVKIKSWSRVANLLEKSGYKKRCEKTNTLNKQIITKEEPGITLDTIKPVQRKDWGEAIDVSIFFGRKSELTKLRTWLIKERCRLVMILGVAGIGKTALSVKLTEEVQDKFEFVIWRSLRLAPSLETFLKQILQSFSQYHNHSQLESIESLISQVIDCLRSVRCLLVLDNIDAILNNDYHQQIDIYSLPEIRFSVGYEGYGELIRRIGESQHQSSVILTSREKPQHISVLEGDNLPVRCIKLSGLSIAESWQVLKTKGFPDGIQEESRVLIDWYVGNPLFLKLVAIYIQELFAGSIYEFLGQGTIVFAEIRRILDQQFNRLSDLEKKILHWLALNQNFVSVRKLQKEILPKVSQRQILEAIELLQRRSLIDRQGNSFAQTPVLMEYIVERLIEENFQATQQNYSNLLMSNIIFEAHLKNYIREKRFDAEI